MCTGTDKRIMWVDDDEDYLAIYKPILDSEGYTVEACFNFHDAIAALHAGVYQIIIIVH